MSLPVVAAVAAMMILTGIVCAVIGFTGSPVKPGPRAVRRRLTFLPALPKQTRIRLAVGAGVGLVIALVSGWVIAIVVLPAAIVGLPYLLGAGVEGKKIERLEAMAEWTRSLSGTLGAGTGLEQAIRATLKSTAEPIRAEVSNLVARLNSRWPTDKALSAFADDLDDATGDKIAAALILGAQRRGAGLSSVLEALAMSVAEDVRDRRAIEAGRAAPRTTARWVTIITTVMLVGLTLTGSYVQPYGTPIGQLILAILLSGYVGVLVWMKNMSKGKPLPRFIGADAARTTRS